MKVFPSDASDHDRKHGAITEPAGTDTHGSQTEREEALWCEVVRLRYRIQRLEKDLAIRDELLGHYRDQKPRVLPPPESPIGYHKCGRFDCQNQIPLKRLYCCRAHSAQQRWEIRKQRELALKEAKLCGTDGNASSE